MQKLLLQPNWDVLPQKDGVHICPLHEGLSPTFLNGRKLAQIFADLITGTTEVDLLEAYPDENLSNLLDHLKKIGAVVLKETDRKEISERNYLDLLENHVIGPDSIVRQIINCPLHKENPFLNTFHISYGAGFAPRLIPYQSSLNGGWGADTNHLLANIKAVVEAVERYALAEYEESSFQMTHWREVKKASLTATQLGTREEVLENVENILWRRLEGITTKRSILAPLDFLHHPVDYNRLGRPPITPLNISGIAGHQSIDAAITNGLLELCEHEALILTWYGQRITSSINPKSLDQGCQEYISRLEEIGWKVILKDISLDLVPVVMAIAHGPLGKRALTIGSCAAFSTKYAARKALTEVVRTVLVDEATSPTFPSLVRQEVNDVLTHGIYYAHTKNLVEAEYLWAGKEYIDATDMLTDGSKRNLTEVQALWEAEGKSAEKEKEYITRILESRGIETYYSEITPHQIRKIGIPLFVARTLAPEMARMTVGYGQVPALTKRFRKLLKKYTDGSAVDASARLHPFS